MSRLRFMGTAAQGETHVVAGIPRLIFPWQYTETLAGGGNLAPIELTRERLVEWWWRLKSLSCTIQLSNPSFAPHSLLPASPATFALTRRYAQGGTAMADDEERNLMRPGADYTEPHGSTPAYFEGSDSFPDWAAGGSLLDIGVTVGLCSYGTPACGLTPDLTSTETETRAWNRVADDVWMPTLWVCVLVQGSTPGVEFTCEAASFPFTQSVDFSASTPAIFCTAIGGDTIAMEGHDNDSVGFDDITLEIQPYTWFEYRDSDGLNPCWDEFSGAAEPGGHIRYPV